jgi:dipeptidyl aminopeptidase/acylaminoacyl peptidase
MRKLKRLVFAAAVSMSPSIAQATPPSAIEITPNDLAGMRSLSSVVLSPDGHYAAFRLEVPDPKSNRWSQQWMLSDLSTGVTLTLADAGDVIEHLSVRPDPELPQWSTDSRWLYFRAAHDGHVGLRRVDIATRHVESLGDPDRYLAEFRVSARGILMRYGSSDAAVAAREEQEYRDGIVLDSTRYVTGEMFRGQWFRGRMATVRLGEGNTWPRRNVLEDAGAETRVLELPSLREHVASPSEIAGFSPPEEAKKRSGGFTESLQHPSADRSALPATLADWKSKVMQEFRLAWRAPSGNVKRCDQSICTGKSISLISPDFHSDVIFSAKDPYNHLTFYRWNPKSGTVAPFWVTNGAASGTSIEESAGYTGTCPVAGRTMVCIYSQPKVPERLVKLDLATGAISELYNPNPGLAPRVHAALVKIAWTVSGRRYYSTLALPEGAARKPIPLLIPTYRCEGGFMRGASAEEFPIFSFVESGIAVLCADNNVDRYRDSPDRYAFTFQAWKAVIPILGEKYGIDTSRVGIAGQSYGAEIAAYSLLYSSLFKAASLGDPNVDPIIYYLYGAGSEGQTFLHSPWYGSLPNPTKGLDRWRRGSLALNAEKVGAPILMQIPEEELPATMQLWTEMHEANKPFELVAFPDEPHAKFQPAHKLAIYQRNLDWFRFWLLGYEDPSPARSDQYVRWRSMKSKIRDPH